MQAAILPTSRILPRSTRRSSMTSTRSTRSMDRRTEGRRRDCCSCPIAACCACGPAITFFMTRRPAGRSSCLAGLRLQPDGCIHDRAAYIAGACCPRSRGAEGDRQGAEGQRARAGQEGYAREGASGSWPDRADRAGADRPAGERKLYSREQSRVPARASLQPLAERGSHAARYHAARLGASGRDRGPRQRSFPQAAPYAYEHGDWRSEQRAVLEGVGWTIICISTKSRRSGLASSVRCMASDRLCCRLSWSATAMSLLLMPSLTSYGTPANDNTPGVRSSSSSLSLSASTPLPSSSN